MANALAHESSLYLRQHANNPVNWYPWGPEALERAKSLDRPIFLSVGYSACHWCHVMEHECFEVESIAAILNAHFVSIKVDREERPDLDQIYMTAHHLLNRGEGGGWPLSVFLTPSLTPFYAGTYFPPDERYAPQRPSFPRLLHSVKDAWVNKRDHLEEVGSQVKEHLQNLGEAAKSDSPLTLESFTGALRSLKRSFDASNGGFGYAPKFPHPLEIQVLLRLARRDPTNGEALQMAELTLEKMARGGMYDQIGGGFHRYSVDAVWLVPHFEKMLYDNALLALAYTEAFRATGDKFFQHIARETLEYVLREMTHAEGGFFSTQDADSEGEEGKFFVWSEAELEMHLGNDGARFAQAVFGTSVAGNFEGHNILCRARSDAEDARIQKLSEAEFQINLLDVKGTLYAQRSDRVWPGRDEKILTAWNGLMIRAFAQAGRAFDEPKYTEAAAKAAGFIENNLRGMNDRLQRTWGEGVGAKLPAYLEDCADYLDGLISLWEATFDPSWLTVAERIAGEMIAHYSDPTGGFFFTADDAEALIARTKDLQDGSVPSGNAMAATALLRLAKLTGHRKYFEVAEGTLKAYRTTLGENAMAAGQLLLALDFYLGPVEEIAVIGSKAEPETQKVLALLGRSFRPNSVIAFHDPNTGPAPLEWLLDKTAIGGIATVYACRDFACSAPLVGFEAVQLWLNSN